MDVFMFPKQWSHPPSQIHSISYSKERCVRSGISSTWLNQSVSLQLWKETIKIFICRQHEPVTSSLLQIFWDPLVANELSNLGRKANSHGDCTFHTHTQNCLNKKLDILKGREFSESLVKQPWSSIAQKNLICKEKAKKSFRAVRIIQVRHFYFYNLFLDTLQNKLSGIKKTEAWESQGSHKSISYCTSCMSNATLFLPSTAKA